MVYENCLNGLDDISAGAVGIEPTSSVLETDVLPLNDTPSFYYLNTVSQKMRPHEAGAFSLFSGDPCLFVNGLQTTPVTKLLEFDLPLNLLLVLIGVIITPFARCATKRY